jgi:hypothetical protein
MLISGFENDTFNQVTIIDMQISLLHLICGYEQLSLILSEEIHHITFKGIM